MTLTLKHSQKKLGNQLTRIWRCFKELRTTAEWKQNVQGFCAFLEAKWSPRTRCWHVHLHILIEGQFWDQKEIKSLWHAVTGDSMIVDIQAKGSAASMAYYGAKYASKPLDAGSMESPEQHADAITQFGSRRLWLIGGSWKGELKLLAKGTDPKDWEYVGTANSLFVDGKLGRPEALALIEELLGSTLALPEPPPRDSS